MRNLYLIAVLTLLAQLSFGQQKLQVHRSGNTMYARELSTIDSIKLDNTYAKFKLSDDSNTLNIQKTLVDSLTFTSNAVNLDKIYIIYNGNDNATIINPYANSGVNITALGGTVAVNATSGIANLQCHILGASANGSLTITTDLPLNLVLNNLTLANPNGAAFNIIGGQAITISLANGTSSTLTDGAAGIQNGTLSSDGPITFNGGGALSVSGLKKQAIYTSSTVIINSGTLAIVTAVSDGIHSEGFGINGGNLTITALGDGIDAGDGAILISAGTIGVTSSSADVKAMKTGNNTITIEGGTLNLNVSGAQSKAISAKGNIIVNNGTINISLSGATVLVAQDSGFNPSYATGLKSDAQIIVTGGDIIIQSLAGADGGKGFSSDGDTNISGGNFTISTAGNGGNYVNPLGAADTFSVSAFSTDTNVNISGGTFTLNNTGNNGKAISADVDVNITGNPQISITNSGSAGKGIKANGNTTFSGGTTTIALSGNIVLVASGSGMNPSYATGVKANNIIVNSGSINIQATATAKGAKGFSADSNITVNNGNITINNAGTGATYTNTTGTLDSYSAAAFSADANLTINGGTVTANSSGTGGKGLKADGIITIGTASSNPTVNLTTTGARFLVSGSDYNHPKTIVATGAVVINNGTTTINSTDDGVHSDASVTINGGNHTIVASSTTNGVGEGVEAPIINFTGGVTNVTASNDGINATYGTVSGGTESNDGSQLNISGGIIIVAGKDAIDSNGNITITGGTTIVCGVTNSPEEGMDFNGTLLMNGGVLISAGSNSNMTKNFGTASTQRCMYLKSSAQLAATSVLHIENAAGTEMVTFKPKNGVYYFHFSSPNIAASTSYKVYFGGTYTGGNFVGNSNGWGLYTGGTYSSTGGTLKTTFTTSATATVNTQTF
ncbi:carbohydrate-binding domain-containing protein [Flavobacterium sp. CYK-4]|uniref:beta strand repeat-containing protein n=1 Tax=Flavobacterium lotistagni TaxID=2709660 RepID=UPI001407AA9B|nr:carbohydrate-binding domain-containing protein [Flavobacterium lotistagni]NHM05850.1 carbohydrate-binding domain-containing protein [Flavobacterium lotistagni]